MKQYHFYLDLSAKETYGQAKLEALFSGLGLIMPFTENNVNLVPNDYDFYSGTIADVADKVAKRIDNFCRFPIEENKCRENARSFAINQYSDTAVWSIMENMYYEFI